MLEPKDLEQIKELLKQTDNQKFECYTSGVNDGKQHNSMSPETATHIEGIKVSINEILIKLAELPQAVIDKCEKKFASKTTEKIVYTMIGIICVGVLTALLATVVKAFN